MSSTREWKAGRILLTDRSTENPFSVAPVAGSLPHLRRGWESPTERTEMGISVQRNLAPARDGNLGPANRRRFRPWVARTVGCRNLYSLPPAPGRRWCCPWPLAAIVFPGQRWSSWLRGGFGAREGDRGPLVGAMRPNGNLHSRKETHENQELSFRGPLGRCSLGPRLGTRGGRAQASGRTRRCAKRRRG